MRMKLLFIYLFFLFLFSCSLVAGIGVSPPIYSIDFDAGMEHTFNFIILNNAGSDINAKISVNSDLAEFITLSDSIIPLAKDGRGDLTVTLNLPTHVEVPGVHKIQIRIQEDTSLGGAMGARAGVIALIVVEVPYPGVYASIVSMSVADDSGGVNEGLDTPLAFSIKNQGTETLEQTRVEVSLWTDDGILMEKSSFEDITLASQEVYSKSMMLSTKDKPASDYRALVTYFYAGKEKEASKTFRVGTFDVKIINYTKEVSQEGIVPFVVKTNSLWKGDLFVEATLTVGDLVNTKSSRIMLDDFQTKDIELFFDANMLPLGEQQALLSLTMEKIGSGELRSKQVPITFSVMEQKKPQREFPQLFAKPITIILIFLIILLVVNVVILGRMFLKKAKKRN
jgi:hypothetical protein